MDADRLHLSVSFAIIEMGLVIKMGGAIYFHDHVQLMAVEVGNEVEDRFLAGEGVTCLPVFNHFPHHGFCHSSVVAKLSGEFRERRIVWRKIARVDKSLRGDA